MSEQPAALILEDPEATARLGSELAAVVEPGLILRLRGELGAGKTALAKALIARHAGLDPDDVTSPTFTLVQEYDEGPFPVYHLDAYRLSGGEALIDLGFDDWLARGDALILIEWPEKVSDALPEEGLEVHLSLEGAGRRAELTADGQAAEAALAALLSLRSAGGDEA